MSIYLLEGRMKEASYAFNKWSVTLDETTTFDQVFKPEFWSHVARHFKIGDTIEVRADKNDMFALLYVRSCSNTHASVSEVFRSDFSAADMSAAGDAEYYVRWASLHHKWAIFRKADRTRVKDGFETEQEAVRAMADYVKKVA